MLSDRERETLRTIEQSLRADTDFVEALSKAHRRGEKRRSVRFCLVAGAILAVVVSVVAIICMAVA